MKLPISVFIIMHNEEARIAESIKSVKEWVEEVIVVDSHSTDRSVDIAKSLGARTFSRDWNGFGAQKRFAEDQCQQDWWFNIDADEVVTPQLASEIQGLFANGTPSPAAYNVRIPYIYPGDERPRPFARDYNVVRFYHKSVGRYRDHPVYDRVELLADTKIRQLKGPLAHHAIVSWSHMIEKANINSSHNIEKLVRLPAWQLKLRIFFGFPLNFIKNYLLRGHIFGGAKGFVFALNAAYQRTLRVAKALEKKQGRNT